MRLLLAGAGIDSAWWIVRSHAACGQGADSGAALEAAELQAVARLAHDVGAWQAFLREPPARVADKLPGLMELSSPLAGSSLKPLAESIERKIMPDGTLADDASPELNRIRREQERQQRVIEESLRSALRRLSGEGSTQEDLITIRGDRFVIPVRSELKRRVSRRGAWRKLVGADGVRGAAGDHRAEQ